MTQNNQLPGLGEIQNRAEKEFTRFSWPSRKEEEWRRTDLTKFDIDKYTENKMSPPTKTLTIVEEKEGPLNYALHISLNAQGAVHAVISKEAADAGVRLSLPTEKESSFKDVIRWTLEKMDNKIGYWNFTCLSESIFLTIPRNTVLSKPVLFEYTYTDSQRLIFFNLFIIAEENTKAEIVQNIKAPGTGLYISGNSTVFAGNNSHIRTAAISEISDSSLFFSHRNFRLDANSKFLDFQNYNGSRLTKSRTEVTLEEDTVEAHLFGTFLAENKEHIDIKTIQNHKAASGKSQAHLKSVVKDSGRTVFQGLIEVEEDGALTDAYLMNNNIVLNNSARADSIPALKIRNNDVKCSHGSTTGKLNPDQIFYLTSRGLDEGNAKKLILEGFFNQVFDKLPESFSSISMPVIEKKLSHAV